MEFRTQTSNYRNTSERNISKTRKALGNESESDNSVEDSDVEISNEETLHLPIPDIERPSTSKELDSDDESAGDILMDFKSVFIGSEKSDPGTDKGLVEVVNEGLQSVRQSEEV